MSHVAQKTPGKWEIHGARFLWHDFYHTHLPSPPCPRSSSHSNLAPVALGKRLELNNSTVSGLRPGWTRNEQTWHRQPGRLLGIYGDQGDQESKQRAFAQTARNKATKKIKQVKQQNDTKCTHHYPSLTHLRIRCNTFLDASLGVVRLTLPCSLRVLAASQISAQPPLMAESVS